MNYEKFRIAAMFLSSFNDEVLKAKSFLINLLSLLQCRYYDLIILRSPILYESKCTINRFFISLFAGGFFSKSDFSSTNLELSYLTRRLRNRNKDYFSIFIQVLL